MTKLSGCLCMMMLTVACDDEPEAADRPALDGPRFAVVSSDFAATAISLLDGAGKLEADDYLTSGSTETGLVTALSGDVVLPTRSGESGVMVLIDRFKTDVITRVRLSDGEILGQLKTDSDDAFSSNPQDYIRIDDDTAWVSRNQRNLNPDADEIDLGDDLLRIDPSTLERTDERIELTSLAGSGTRTNPDTGEEEEVELYAHPSRIVRIGDKLVVGLGHASYDFSAVGEGKVALVDVESGEAKAFDLPGLKGCSQVSPVPGASDRVLVGCDGDFSQPGESEGAAILRVTNGVAKLESTWRLADHADGPALSGSYAPIDAKTITAAYNAFAPGSGDSVFGTLDLESGELSELLSIPAGEGTFGTPLYDAASKKLFLPDASVDSDMRPTAGVRVLSRSDDGFEEDDLIQVSESTGLPARFIFGL